MPSPIAELLAAKRESDRGNYAAKAKILRQMMERRPQDFIRDSTEGYFHGITHVPSGFRLHLPAKVIPPEVSAAGKTVPGLPDRTDFGDLDKLSPGQVLTMLRQRHKAERAGEHEDIRIGSPELGLFSWAARKGIPGPGEKRLAIQQPRHSWDYRSFEGTIPSGYGKGEVSKLEESPIVVTRITPNAIHLTRGSGRHLERFTLIRPKDPSDKNWLMINTTPTKPLENGKASYTSIPADKVEDALRNFRAGDSAQAKIDGALTLTRLLKDGVEVTSHRTAKGTGFPITHTERVFGGTRPNLRIPPELVGTVLKGELYGTKGNKVIPPQELGGILNASLVGALDRQREKKIKLRNMIFDIAQQGKRRISPDVPYAERRKLIRKALASLPRDVFHPPEEATTKEEALRLWKKIRTGKHPLTQEGLVIHPSTGTPVKAKLRDEADVHITGTFPGTGRRAATIGGLTYALTPGGSSAGRLGTGFSEETLRSFAEDPESVIGRLARISSRGQFPSGAHREPSFISLHEDYQPKEAYAKTSPEAANLRPAEADRNCGTCIHYDGAGGCALVAGYVDDTMVSDFYAKVHEASFAGLGDVVKPEGMTPVEGIPEASETPSAMESVL